MERTSWRLLILILFPIFFCLFGVSSAAIYNVKLGSQFINIVDKNFLSFTLDPKHLFSSVEMFHNMESNCIASFLTPAYLRIAGPSTGLIAFKNSTTNADNRRSRIKKQMPNLRRQIKRRITKSIDITEGQWLKFMQWANKTGFDIVFALSNEEKAPSGLWNPESATALLSMAKKADGELFWQLGYECKGQSIHQYLHDLETLRSIVEKTMPKLSNWRIVAGDVSNCFSPNKNEFTDYINMSVNITDALLLNGNSTYHELAKLSSTDQLELLNIIHSSKKPLWMTEDNQYVHSEVERAVDWLTSLGYSARSGFHVYFRKLIEEELYESGLSFYMALLFKNLVGERVLPVQNLLESIQPDLFAHCTSLRHMPILGAITLYGANINDEPAKLLLEISDHEEAGELMKFIMKNDNNGNIIVNGREMTNEGDIHPVVKRIQPYKTLMLNLPPRSFGFWVLANTTIEACRGISEEESSSEIDIINDIDNTKNRRKRYIHSSLDNLATNLRSDLKYQIKEFKDLSNQFKKRSADKVKRDIKESRERNNIRRQLKPIKAATLSDIVDKVLDQHKLRKFLRLNKNKSFTKDNNSARIDHKDRVRRHILNLRNYEASGSSNHSLLENTPMNSDVIKNPIETKNYISLLSDITSRFPNSKHNNYNDSDIKIDYNNDSITFKIKSLFETAIAKEAAKALKYVAEKVKILAQNAGMDE